MKEEHPPHIVPSASSSAAGEQFARLVELTHVLRSPSGCPWDREQTLESLRPFVLEEAYEVLDAIDRGDRPALEQEVGDLIHEGVFLAELSAEQGDFTIADAVRSVTDKLVQRHPHVFGGGPHLTSAEAVLEQWERLKGRERQDTAKAATTLGGMPRTLPALLRAFEIGNRTAAVGLDWIDAADVLSKIEEEVAELRRAVEREGPDRAEEEMGDLLFALANLSRKMGIDPEAALRKANDRFTTRFNALEHRFHERGQSLPDSTLEQMESEWQRIKEERPQQS